MLITCPSCANHYTIDAGQVGAGGRRVRCAACRSTWFVAGQAGPAPSPEFAEDPVAQASDGLAHTSAPFGVDVESPAQTAISADAQTARNIADPPPPGAQTAPSQRRKALRRYGSAKPKRPSTAARRAVVLVAIAAAITMALMAVVGRAALVRLWPETAILYAAVGAPVNLRGLALSGVRSELQNLEQDTVLVVEGEIANPTSREVAVPRLALALRSTTDEALYTWTSEPPRRTLGPGETARFRAKLASPPAEARQVLVRFAAASDGTSVAAIEK